MDNIIKYLSENISHRYISSQDYLFYTFFGSKDNVKAPYKDSCKESALWRMRTETDGILLFNIKPDKVEKIRESLLEIEKLMGMPESKTILLNVGNCCFLRVDGWNKNFVQRDVLNLLIKAMTRKMPPKLESLGDFIHYMYGSSYLSGLLPRQACKYYYLDFLRNFKSLEETLNWKNIGFFQYFDTPIGNVYLNGTVLFVSYHPIFNDLRKKIDEKDLTN